MHKCDLLDHPVRGKIGQKGKKKRLFINGIMYSGIVTSVSSQKMK